MAQPLRSTPITGASPLLRAGPPAHRSRPVRLPKFHARAADQAHAASMPDTARPVIGTPAEPSSHSPEHGHGFDAPSNVTTRRQRFGFTHLPGPHLTHPVRLFHIAHHDGLQPTQHVAVWHPPPKDDAEGPTFISRTAPAHKGPPTSSETPPFAVHGTRSGELEAKRPGGVGEPAVVGGSQV